MSQQAIEFLLEDHETSIRPCLYDFQCMVLKKVEDALKKKFDSLMRMFIHQKALDTHKYNDLKDKFVGDIMSLLRPKYEGLLNDDELKARIQAVNPKKEFNFEMDEANILAKLLKPFKYEQLETFKQLKDKVSKLKKAEEKIIEELQLEMAEVQSKQRCIKNQTLKMISGEYNTDLPILPVTDSD